MVSFEHNGKKYNYIPYNELSDEDFPNDKEKISDDEYAIEHYRKENFYERNHYIDIGAGFDIETTHIDNTDLSTMYVWQFSLDNITILGRSWEEFRELLQRISKIYNLHEDRKLLVWIHNFKYEFSFLKGQVNWNKITDRKTGMTKPDIFATDNITVIKSVTEEFIEFRDSYILTQLPLEKLAKNYNLGIEKLKGDLDYNLQRHSDTPLTNEEIAYCINDVQILQKFYHKYIKVYFIKNKLGIPLTMTGIVRSELYQEFMKLSKKEREKYKKFIKNSMPTQLEYNEMMNFLFRGGFNHANKIYSDEIMDNYYDEDLAISRSFYMGSYDFKSSYPAVMLHEKLPTKFTKDNVNFFYIYANNKKWLKNNAYWGIFNIYNVSLKTSHSLESESKILKYSDDAKFDNGRLMSASKITVMLTDQDVLNYFDIYNVDDLKQWECLELYTAHKEELPKFFKNLILKYYYLKETLPKDTLEYNIAKAKLNALYGMCVSALLYEENIYDEEEQKFYSIESQKEFDDAIKRVILLPQWGIYIAGIARRNLVKTFAKLGDDAMYGDTDSAKIINVIGNEYIFKDYNDRIYRMNKTMYVGNYDRKIFEKIGIFDYEGRIYKFKTLGCKRYLSKVVEFDKEKKKYHTYDKTTVAGMKKGSLQAYCKENGKDIYKEFTDNMYLDEEHSMKTTTKYINEPFTYNLTDYLGNDKIISENSCCTLVKIPFSLTMKDYLQLLLLLEQEGKKRGRFYV